MGDKRTMSTIIAHPALYPAFWSLKPIAGDTKRRRFQRLIQNRSGMVKIPMRACLLFALLLAFAPAYSETPANQLPTIAAKASGMHPIDGFLPLFWDPAAGKLYLEIPHLDTDLLYTNSLPYGTGSNDLGLDRGQLSEGRMVRFERSGPKVLLVQPNSNFRSSSTDSAETLAVTQSFPESVLWGFTVAAEDPSGAVLVDATDFFLHDAHRVVETLAALHQGAYHVDQPDPPSRSRHQRVSEEHGDRSCAHLHRGRAAESSVCG